MTYKQVEKSKNKYKFEVEVDFKEFEEERQKALQKLSSKVKIAGFRPGKAPKDAVEKEVGYNAYLEAVNKILPKAALEVIEKENLNPISSFKYDLKDLDKEQNISFSFEFVTQPEIKLEQFKKIKLDYKEPKLEKDEADQVIKNIIVSSLPREKWEKNIVKKETSKKAKDGESKKTEEDHHHEDGQPHNHLHDGEDLTITDELVEAIGYQEEKTYDGLKKQVEETLNRVKKEDADNEFAGRVIDEAIKLTDFEVPEDFIEREVEHRESHFNERLQEVKLNQEMYLKTQGTTLEELRKTWRADADKAVRTDLILINLGVSENLSPTEEEIDEQIAKYQDPRVQAQYKSEESRNYLRSALTRDKALMKLIEGAKK